MLPPQVSRLRQSSSFRDIIQDTPLWELEETDTAPMDFYAESVDDGQEEEDYE
jgi:hypothetical protein